MLIALIKNKLQQFKWPQIYHQLQWWMQMFSGHRFWNVNFFKIKAVENQEVRFALPRQFNETKSSDNNDNEACKSDWLSTALHTLVLQNLTHLIPFSISVNGTWDLGNRTWTRFMFGGSIRHGHMKVSSHTDRKQDQDRLFGRTLGRSHAEKQILITALPLLDWIYELHTGLKSPPASWREEGILFFFILSLWSWVSLPCPEFGDQYRNQYDRFSISTHTHTHLMGRCKTGPTSLSLKNAIR